MEYPYDVAISFLSGDEPLASQLCECPFPETSKCLSFLKNKKETRETEGLESFRQVFFSQSRLQIVLYRDGWGKTKWTGVEELAIKDRVYNGGGDSLLFVELNEESVLPNWLPQTAVEFELLSLWRGPGRGRRFAGCLEKKFGKSVGGRNSTC